MRHVVVDARASCAGCESGSTTSEPCRGKGSYRRPKERHAILASECRGIDVSGSILQSSSKVGLRCEVARKKTVHLPRTERDDGWADPSPDVLQAASRGQNRRAGNAEKKRIRGELWKTLQNSRLSSSVSFPDLRRYAQGLKISSSWRWVKDTREGRAMGHMHRGTASTSFKALATAKTLTRCGAGPEPIRARSDAMPVPLLPGPCETATVPPKLWERALPLRQPLSIMVAAVLHRTVQYSTARHRRAQLRYSTVQHGTARYEGMRWSIDGAAMDAHRT